MAPGVARVRGLTIIAGVICVCASCFVYAPVRTTPRPGAQVALDLTDEGSVAVTATLGPGVRRVEGTLVAADGEEFLLDGLAVTMTRGYQTPLDTVRVQVNQRHVSVLQERRLSRGRTYPVVGGAVALVAAFFITRGFVGRGTPPEGPPAPPPTDNSVRAP